MVLVSRRLEVNSVLSLALVAEVVLGFTGNALRIDPFSLVCFVFRVDWI